MKIINQGIDKNNRIIEIDYLRGIAIIFMIFDHFMYDIFGFLPNLFSDFPKDSGLSFNIYSLASEYWRRDLRYFFRYVIIFVFMGLVGICASFSKNNIKRGSKLLGVSLVLSLLTYILSIAMKDPSMLITFGTLHCISLSLLFVGVLLKFIDNRFFYLLLGIFMIVIGAYFEYNVLVLDFGDESIFLIIIKQIAGLVECGGDTTPFLLNGGQVLVGVFLGKTFYKNKESLTRLEYKNNLVTFFGRNALVVYFLHQIFIPIILSILLLILGYTFVF